MFKIEYDPKVKALYIHFKDIGPGEVAHTKEVEEYINIDYNKEGEILGIELLNIE